jgi:hypothetical protein
MYICLISSYSWCGEWARSFKVGFQIVKAHLNLMRFAMSQPTYKPSWFISLSRKMTKWCLQCTTVSSLHFLWLIQTFRGNIDSGLCDTTVHHSTMSITCHETFTATEIYSSWADRCLRWFKYTDVSETTLIFCCKDRAFWNETVQWPT